MHIARQAWNASKPRPRKTVVSQLQVNQTAQWTMGKIRSALDQHEDGNLQQSGILAEAMMRQPRIRADVHTRANALVGKNGAEFTIKPVSEDNTRSKQYAEAIDEWWYRAFPDAHQHRAVRDSVICGVTYGPIQWVEVNSQWEPRLKPWNTSNLWYFEEEDQWYCHAKGGQVPVTAGDGQWFLHEPGGSNTYLSGAVRALGVPFLFLSFNDRDWARFNERHGMPTIIIREPEGLEEAETSTFYERMAALGREPIVSIPQSTNGGTPGDVEFREFTGSGSETFGEFIAHLEKAVTITLLGQNLTTDVEGGSYAAAQTHYRVRQDYLDADAETLTTTLREQVIIPWGRLNFPNWNDDDAPWPCWETGAAEDKGAKAKTHVDASQALTQWQDAGVPVDTEAYAEDFGLPLLDGAERQEFEAQQEEKKAAAEALRQQLAQGAADKANDADAIDDDSDEDEPENRARLATIGLASGFVEGQLYADAVTEQASREFADALQGDVRAILDVVEKAKDYDDLREQLRALYDERMDPEALNTIVHRALVMAQLGGFAGAVQDTPKTAEL